MIQRFAPYLLICLLGWGCATETLEIDNRTEKLSQFERDMLDAVNTMRAEGCRCGEEEMDPVPLLNWNPKLTEAAERHVVDMSDNDHFSHTGTDGSSFGQRIEEAGYAFTIAAENIAKGYSSIETVMEGWKNSEGHCRNIMHPDIRELGAAEKKSYWAQEFGRSIN